MLVFLEIPSALRFQLCNARVASLEQVIARWNDTCFDVERMVYGAREVQLLCVRVIVTVPRW